MANFNIDRLKFRWKGNWVTGTQYVKDDIVYYDGKAYVCLQGHTATTFFNDNYPDSDVTFTVTVSTDTLDGNSQGKIYIDGVENPSLHLIKGKTYIFNQDAESNDSDPLLLSSIFDGDLEGGTRFSNGVAYYIDDALVTEANYIANFAAATTREIRFTVPSNAPVKVYYYSANNKNMGSFLKTRYDSNWEIMFDGSAWRGAWTTGQFYTEGSFVKYNGNIYKCIVAHTSTTTLTADIANWSLFASGFNWLDEWTTSTDYIIGDVVRYNGNTYICNETHSSAATTASGLEADQEKWTTVVVSDNWKTDWQTSTRYIVNDVVKHGAIVYRCIQSHTSAATVNDGLEADQAKWEIVNSGVEYRSAWAAETKYRVNDIVKYGASLWKANTGHVSTAESSELRFDEAKWDIWIPGLHYELIYNSATEYGQGNVVLYGGYAYVALRNNLNKVPGVDTDDWQLVTTGYNLVGDWHSSPTYLTGDVVRSGGNLYVAITNNSNVVPASDTALWTKIVDADSYHSTWNDNTEYFENDLVIFKGILYKCIAYHVSTESDSRPDLDIQQPDQDYWQVLINSTPNNVLSTLGDIKTYNQEITNLAIGNPGEVAQVASDNVTYGGYEQIDNVFYVGTNGIDVETAGRTVAVPFRTIKYACEYVQDNIAINADNTTIFIKTGYYEEELPIKVPRNTALVGDELRSTTVAPAAGFETSNMFYVNNGSGIRNMTLQGLNGTLGAPNQYLTRRPSAGAFVSLDPGSGPTDETVWITTKSCYVQNVSAFGTGCVGMKVDGALHNGGNRSIVANDFTQIISDGIGYWATNQGRSELVSVFTYYCHIGYLAENGGILRATNGNNSYGTYGSVAEGFDSNETPITGTVNNRLQEAQFSEAFTYGTDEQAILAIGYSHAGQDYTSASVTFSGSGTGAAGTFTEFRNNAISNIRMLDPGDSSTPGGLNYTFVVNNAQSGNQSQIQLSQADIREAADYIGQRIVIISGLGVGQYAQITGYDANSKVAIVSKETDGSNGWDHFQPGWPIENTLDSTTRYSIEPRIDAEEPAFSTSANTNLSGSDIDPYYIASGGGSYLITGIDLDGTGSNYYLSDDGGATWTNVLNGPTTATDLTQTAWTGSVFISLPLGSVDIYVKMQPDGTYAFDTTTTLSVPSKVLFSDGNGYVYHIGNTATLGDFVASVSTDNGDSWTNSSAILGTLASGEENFNYFQAGAASTYGTAVILASDGLIGLSTDFGSTWTTSSPLSAGTWTDLAYGNGRWIAVGTVAGETTFARSFDGVTWYEETVTTPTPFTCIQYGEGTFMSFGQSATNDENIIGFSAGGDTWRLVDSDSTAFGFHNLGDWSDAAYGSDGWIAIENLTTNLSQIDYGARPVLRARVTNSAVSQLVVYDPGSNLPANPTVTIFDNGANINAVFEINVNNGVLAQPQMSNRGTGYFTASATFSGNGFAELYQTGKFIKVSNLTAIPEPGDNLNIDGIDDVLYSVVKVIEISESHPYTATLQITPTIGVAESPDHNTSLTLRKRFSQIRLTGHDFLDIGTGNQNSTRYPDLYLEGEDAENARQPFNEALGFGGGRVFFTSTDQDGNFKVGSLFKVEQSTGIVSIDASQFDLSGLTELSLGGIQVGVTPVIIREFSIDGKFTANSNSIVPTQKAIASYIEDRISGGGSDVSTNTLIAGQVRITGNTIDTTSDLAIDIPVKLNVKKGHEGIFLAQQFFTRSSR